MHDTTEAVLAFMGSAVLTFGLAVAVYAVLGWVVG